MSDDFDIGKMLEEQVRRFRRLAKAEAALQWRNPDPRSADAFIYGPEADARRAEYDAALAELKSSYVGDKK